MCSRRSGLLEVLHLLQPPSTVSLLALLANFRDRFDDDWRASVYLLQRFMLRFSLLALFKLSLGYVVLWCLSRLIGTFVGYQIAGWYRNSLYFSPMVIAFGVKYFENRNVARLIPRIKSRPLTTHLTATTARMMHSQPLRNSTGMVIGPPPSTCIISC